jgi:hypothetical protein
MKTRVLDSWAILEWMNGRKPADTHVDALLADGEGGKARLLMSAINVGEVYYFLRKDQRPVLGAPLFQKYNCPLVTGDPEFRSVDQLGVDWIGRE